MSLEDKAKEYSHEHGRPVGEDYECDSTYEEIEDCYKTAYREALKDMMEVLLSDEYSHKQDDLYNKNRRICTVSEADLEKIAEDLGGK